MILDGEESSQGITMSISRYEVLPDLFIVPDISSGRINVSFTVPSGVEKADWRVLDADKIVAFGSAEVQATLPTSFQAGMGECKLWNVDTPHLYELKLTFSGDDGSVEVAEKFGMRQIRADQRSIYVNDEPFFVRGYIRGREAHDHPNLLDLPLEDYYAKNIRIAKAHGFNFVRFHSQIPPDECFDAADRLGIFIHVEMRSYFGIYQKERAGLDDRGELIDLDQWEQMILRLRNRPSLMVYCIGNEIRHPGTNPQVERIAEITKRLDPTRMFIDTTAHGEFDRTYVDIDVQHMTYFYPFGKDYDMFENTQNWLIYGSCKGAPMVCPDGESDTPAQVTRALAPSHPVLAHEIGHYAALRDLDALDAKFAEVSTAKPWWVDELRKLVDIKGLTGDYAKMRQASKRFQMIGWKLAIEGARRSRILSGFHFLQLSDTDRYENCNGIVDCFDEPAGVDETEFLKFNGPTTVLADLPRRTFFEGEELAIPVLVSHFAPEIGGKADFSFTLKSDDGSVDISGGLGRIDMDQRGRRDICHLRIKLPKCDSAKATRLTASLQAEDGSWRVSSDWNLWVYPNRPAQVELPPCTVDLDGIDLSRRYPQLQTSGTLEAPAKLLVVNRFSEEVLRHASAGGDVLMLYRVGETRDRKTPSDPEKLYLPTVWDRFKGVIWDRGTNLGAFIRPSAALDGFPNDGLIDLQFHGLIDDCDKICLDGFPCDVEPIIQGVDKASRDRFDVFTFGLSELQPEWTMRKFAYLFELRVGKGRMLVSGMNFTGLMSDSPAVCCMFESLLRYATSDAFDPAVSISADELSSWLTAKGAAPRTKERMMTQYWQLNEEPLESAQYWLDAEQYIRRG